MSALPYLCEIRTDVPGRHMAKDELETITEDNWGRLICALVLF